MKDNKQESRLHRSDKKNKSRKSVPDIVLTISKKENVFEVVKEPEADECSKNEEIPSGLEKLNKRFTKCMTILPQAPDQSILRHSVGEENKLLVDNSMEVDDLTLSQKRLHARRSVIAGFTSAPPIIGLLEKFEETRDKKIDIVAPGSLTKVETIIMKKKKEALLLSDFYNSNQSYFAKKEDKEQGMTISRETFDEISKMSELELYQRATFCFKHAILSKTVRFSFSSKRIRSLYEFHIKAGWQLFIMIMAWLYLFLIFYEPVHSTDFSITAYSASYIVMLVLEIFILSSLLIELVLEIIIKFTERNMHRISKKYPLNFKLISKIIVESGLIIDLCLFYSLYPKGIEYFRFGKLLRPFAIMYFHQYSRRTATSIAKTWKYILDMMLMVYLMVVIFALVAVKMVKQKIDDVKNDPALNAENDLTTWGNAIVTLYFLTSLTNYPSVIIPYMRISYNYFFLFFPYILLIVFLIIPIPVAILFYKYKRNSGKLLLKDKYREKHALFLTHSFLDSEGEGYLKFEQWKKFIGTLFIYKTEKEIKELEDIFFLFDVNDDDQMDIQEFLAACELILSLRDLTDLLTPKIVGWSTIQKFLNEKLKLKAILYSKIFETFRFCAILTSLVLTVITVLSTNEGTIKLANTIDYYILYGFTVEIFLKIVALGPIKFFQDPLTILDTFCVVISFFLYAPINFLRILKYPNTASALKATSKQKNHKKGNKKCRYNPFVILITSIMRIKSNMSKIILAFGAVNQFILIIWLLFYIYAVIALEWFYECEFSSKYSIFQDMFFGGFTTFPLALMTLFQIITQSGWQQMVLNYAEKDSQYTLVVIFFALFHFLLVVILINLVIGIIWEVLTMINNQRISGTERKNEESVVKEEIIGEEKGKENDQNNRQESKKEELAPNQRLTKAFRNVKNMLSFTRQEKDNNILPDGNDSITNSFSSSSNSSILSDDSKSKRGDKLNQSFSGALESNRAFLEEHKMRLFTGGQHSEKPIQTPESPSTKKAKERKAQAIEGAAFAVRPTYFLEKGLLEQIGSKATKMQTDLLHNLHQESFRKKPTKEKKNTLDENNLGNVELPAIDETTNKKVKQDSHKKKKIIKQILNNSSINLMRHIRRSFFPRTCVSGLNLIMEKMHLNLPKGVLFTICQIVEKKINETTKNHIYFPYYEEQGIGGNPSSIEIPNNILDDLIPNLNFSKLSNYFDVSNQIAEMNDLEEDCESENSIKVSIYKAFSEISSILKSRFGYLNKKNYHFDIYIEVIKSFEGEQVFANQDISFFQEIPQRPSLESIRNTYIPNERPQNEQGRGESTVKDTLLIWIIPVEKSHNASFKLLFERGKENRLSQIGEKEILGFNEDIKEGGITRYWRKYEQFMNEFYEALDRLGLPDRPEQESLKEVSIPGIDSLLDLDLNIP